MRGRPVAIVSLVALLAFAAVSIPRDGAAQTPAIGASPPANARVSQDNVAIHAEPSVAVNPANPRNLLAAAQLIADSGLIEIGAFASFDGGQTWRDAGPLPFPAGANTGDDVTVAFDGAGHGFVAAMATSQDANGMSQINRGVYVWRTDDGGRVFAAPVAAVNHQFVDHPWLAVGPDSGVLYAVWVTKDHKGLGFTRSTDGGKSFAPPTTISNPPGGVSVPVVAVGPNGAVRAVYETGINGADPFVEGDDGAALNAPAAQPAPGGIDAQIEVVSSDEGGTTFGGPVLVASAPSEPSPAHGIALPTGPSIATDANGGVDVAFVANRPGSNQLVVMMAHKRGQSRAFDAPVRVDRTPDGAADAFFQPQIVIDETGAIDITAFAFKDGRVNLVLWRGPGAGGGFGDAETITSESFDPAKGLTRTKHGAWWIGDYQGLATGGGAIYPLWNDARTGNLELFTAAIPVHSGDLTGATPAASPATGEVSAVQATRGPGFPDHAEPSIAIDPTDPNHLLGAAQFFDRPGPSPKAGVFVSFDRGATWTDHAPLPLPEGIILANDTTVAFGPRGTAYVSAGLGSQSGEGGVAIWRSDDGGRTFGQPVRVATAAADHPWLAVDPGPGPNAGTLYLAWAGRGSAGLLFSRSTDGGRTFETPRTISGSQDVHPDLAVVTVGRTGVVYVVYGQTELVASSDAGVTFGPPRALPTDRIARSANPAAALNTLPAAAADPAGGALYVATAESLASTGHRTILLWRTTDAGQTWSDPTPLPLNARGDAYQPALAVGPTGLVAVSAYVVNGDRVGLVVALSTDHGATATSVQTVGSVFEPAADLKPDSLGHFKQTGALPWIGDYQGLAVGTDAVYPCWTDTSAGQMEIFVGKIPLPI